MFRQRCRRGTISSPGVVDTTRLATVAPMGPTSARVARLLEPVDVAGGIGLELGPLTNPVVRRDMVDARDGSVTADVRYLDHVDTAALRDRYRTHAGFDVEAIVPIDYASAGRSIRSTVGADAPFHYVIASHVVEHVPDLIGWLTDVRSVLADDGVVSLAVPDHRRCFDVLRTPTVLADVVEAHLLAATVPSTRQVFDHHISARSWRGQIAWNDDPPLDELAPVHPDEEALERATAAAAGRYDDVHCWVFTPRSFVDLFAGLQRLALVGFDLVSCSETESGEFFAALRPADPLHATVPGGQGSGRRVPATAEQRERLTHSTSELDALRREHAAMLASRSWSVTSPLRRANAYAARIRTRLRR